MPIVSMNHFTVLTDDLEGTRRFYVDLLGLDEGHRPDLGFPGTWLYAGGQAVLHVIAGRALPEQRGGVIDHMAFTATELGVTVERLKAQGVDFTLRRQAESEIWQMFVFDPNGAKVELNFSADESAPD